MTILTKLFIILSSFGRKKLDKTGFIPFLPFCLEETGFGQKSTPLIGQMIRNEEVTAHFIILQLLVWWKGHITSPVVREGHLLWWSRRRSMWRSWSVAARFCGWGKMGVRWWILFSPLTTWTWLYWSTHVRWCQWNWSFCQVCEFSNPLCMTLTSVLHTSNNAGLCHNPSVYQRLDNLSEDKLWQGITLNLLTYWPLGGVIII